MKLYFPTSSLNFNDMFATESISPKIFYTNRSFGTKRNFTTELGVNENVLILFKKIPNFNLLKLNKGPYDEYPLILELDLNQKEYNLKQLNEEVYIIDKTIYFNLDNMKLLFLNEEHIERVIQKSKLVIETKCVSKYMKNFNILNDYKRITSISMPCKIEPTALRIETELELDRIFNCIKGVLYGFLFSYNTKVDENIIIMRQVAYKLNELLTDSSKLQGESEVVNDILLFAKDQVKKQYSKFKNSSLHTSNIDIDNLFKFEKRKISFKSELFSEKTEQELFEKILTYLINNSKGKLGGLEKNEKNNLVKEVTSITKSIESKNKFEEDTFIFYKRFLMDRYETNIKDINSIVLQNLYALILKYNSPDEMKLFLKEKNIEKNFILYTFLGAFVGYSGLDRQITEKILKPVNNNLVREIDNFLDDIRKEIRESLLDVECHLNQLSLESELFEESSISTKNQEDNFYLNKSDILVKDIYKEIQLLKQNKVMRNLIKSKNISLENEAIIDFEKSDNNFKMSITYKNDFYEILFIHKENANKELIINYKKELKLIGVDGNFVRGNYPIVNIPLLNNREKLSSETYKGFLECLKLLNTNVKCY